MVIYADDVDFTLRFYEENSDVVDDNENLLLKRENDTCVCAFKSGMIRFKSGMKSVCLKTDTFSCWMFK